MSVRNLYISLLTLFFQQTYGQVDTDYSVGFNTNISNLDELWTLQIEGKPKNSQTFKIEILVKDSNDNVVYKATGHCIYTASKNGRYSKNDIRIVSEYKSFDEAEHASLNCTYSLYGSSLAKTPVYVTSAEIRYTPSPVKQPKDKKNSAVDSLKKSFQNSMPHGQISLGYTYSNQKMDGQEIAQKYYTLNGNLETHLSLLPVNIGFLMTDMNKNTGYNSNYFRVGIDTKKLADEQRRKYLDKASLDKLPDIRTEKLLDSFTGNLQQLDRLVNSESVRKNMRLLNMRDSLMALPDSLKNNDSVSGIIDSLAYLEKKRAMYTEIYQKYQMLNDSVMRQIKLDTGLNSQLKEFISDSVENNVCRISERFKNKSDSIRNLGNMENEKGRLKKNPLDYLENIKKIEVGVVTPVYDDYTMMGIPVKGADIEYENKKFYYSLAAGKYTSSRFSGNSFENSDGFMAAIGAGYKFNPGNSVILRYIDFGENKNQVFGRSKNKVYSIGAENTLLKKVVFKSRIALSKSPVQKNENSVLNNMVVSEQGTSPANQLAGAEESILSTFFRNNENPGIAYGVSMEAPLLKNTGNLTLKVDQRSKDFQSMGVPFMYSDMRSYEGSIEKSLFKNVLSLQTTTRYANDNLSGTRPVSNVYLNIVNTLKMNFRNLPSVILMYSPNSQENEAVKINNRFGNMIINHIIVGEKARHLIGLSVFQSYSHVNGMQTVSTNTVKLNYSYSYGKKLTVSSGVGRNTLINKSFRNDNLLSNIGITLTGEKWDIGTGTNLLFGNSQKRYGGYVQGQYKLNGLGAIAGLRIEKNVFENTYNNTIDQWLGTIIVTKQL